MSHGTDDQRLTGIGFDEGRARTFVAGLRTELRTVASGEVQRRGDPPTLVGDVMQRPVASVPTTARLEDVAALMGGLRIPWVVVDALTADRAGEVARWHVVSDLDVLRAAMTDASRTAGSIATVPPLCVDVRDDLARASAALLARECPCAVVVEDGLPAGLVSACDIAAAWAG